jgi:hypothetical protein
MTTPLTPIHGHTNAAHINNARQLAADVEALGGALSPALGNILDAHGLLSTPPAASDPHTAVIDEAATGTLTAAKLDKLIASAAQAHAAAQMRRELAGRASRDLLQRFGRELLDGGADAILASLRPAFDGAAATIEEALQLVDLSQPYSTFIDEADPDELAAYQRLRPAADTIDRIVALAMQFGPRSITFPLIVRPVEGIGHEEFSLDDWAIFTATPEGVRSASQYMRDYHDAVASQRSIKPTDICMRFSPWLRGGLRLNSVTEARESVRQWAETKWDNQLSPDLVGRLRNPYALSDDKQLAC